MPNGVGSFAGGFSQGFSRSFGAAQQRRSRQQELELQRQRFEEAKRQFGVTQGLAERQFDAQEAFRQSQQQFQQQQTEIEAKQTDLLVIDRFQTALSTKTSAVARPFLIEELAKFLGHDPKSERVQQLIKMTKSADADDRAAMTRIISKLGALPPGQATDFARMVFSGQISFHDLLKASLEAGREEGFTLSPGETRFRGGEPLASVPPQPESFTLGPGQQRFREGEPIAEVPPTPQRPVEVFDPEAPEGARGRLVPRDEAIGQFSPERGPQVQIDNIGNIPPGYELQRDEQGRPARLMPIPGSPAEREQQDAERKAAQLRAQKKRYADVVTVKVDEAMKLITEATVPVTGIGSSLSLIPGTPAHDVSKAIETIQANVGFDRLQELRDASPTGGALGQVSDFENRLLQATLGSLAQSQSERALINNLKWVKNVYMDIIHGPGEGPPREKLLSLEEEQSRDPLDEVFPPEEGVPPGVDPETWKFMTPEEKRLWQN